MKVKVLVDTSAWIEFLRPSGDQNIKAQVADVLASGRAAFTCPVRFELYAGARKSETRTLDEALILWWVGLSGRRGQRWS